MFILATLFLIVVMLNLLISIISDTFSRVRSQSKERMYGEFARMVVEHRDVVTDEDLDQAEQRGQYLYIAWVDDS